MNRWAKHWWKQLSIQHKLWAVLLLLCVPLALGLASHLYLVRELLGVQHLRHDLVVAGSKVDLLRRLTIDVEDGFRGYLLTEQPAFLAPFTEAEAKIDQALEETKRALAAVSYSSEPITQIEQQLKDLLRSKRKLLEDIRDGHTKDVLAYVRSSEGLLQSDRLRKQLRTVEDHLDRRRFALNDQAETLSQKTFAGLWIVLGAVVFLGWVVSRMLARSLTDPIRQLQTATAHLAAHPSSSATTELLSASLFSRDELGELAKSYLHMARRIEEHVHELEVLSTIGHDINTIGPDGLDGVLRRITDRAVELVKADVCLLLLRDEHMACWVVEAASGEWNDRLKKSVLLWEELPVSVQAYETCDVAAGEQLRADTRPQVLRRNLIGDSMLAIPLLSQGVPFGVLALLSQRPRCKSDWNVRLARGLAQEAALAISNARLYDAVEQNQRGLQARLRQLEHQAEALAHDLKGPSERIRELAGILQREYRHRFDPMALKWIVLLERNSREMVERVEAILAIARIGSKQMALIAVDPGLILDQVLKSHVDELERVEAVVQVASGFPLVACHPEYLRQIFDNLLSNSLKYTRPGERPNITIFSRTEDNSVCFAIADRGIGIPTDQRSRVFLPFVRLEPSKTDGTGIGLAIVKRIVELYGGRVWIEGREDEGCMVRFTLPVLGQVSSSPGSERWTDTKVTS